MRKVWSATVVGDKGTIEVEKFIDRDGNETVIVDRCPREFQDVGYALEVAKHIAQSGPEGVVA